MSYGFTNHSLTSKNALIPIIYYIYHKNITNQFSTKTTYLKDREEIKKWLHVVLIKRIFGSSADTLLSQIRNAFTDDFNKNKINDKLDLFPSALISKKIKKDTSISDEFISELLCTQKDNKYAFSILSLLYPNLDYKNNDFHKDHLHPISKFKNKNITKLNVNEDIKEEYYRDVDFNNGLYNLQMLDANENMSKNDLNLKEWVETETKNRDKKQFLNNHLIPDVDLSFENFQEFINKRESILIDKLKAILN
jgi:hypothetical protein